MGAVMGLAPIHRWARFYFEKAKDLSAKLGDPNIQAFVLAHLGYYEAGIGHWDECEETLERSRELYDRVGDVRLAEEAISILAYALFFKGDLERSMELYRTLQRSGEERADGQIISWGLTNRAKVMVRDASRAAEVKKRPPSPAHLASADDLLKQVDGVLIDGITSTVRDGVTVELELARGDLQAALERALAAATRLERSPPRSFMAVSTYAAISHTILESWRSALERGAQGEARDLRRRAESANRALAKLARVFPIATPAHLLHTGTFEALSGRASRARALWERARDLATERVLPFEETQAHAALEGVREESGPNRPRRLLDRLRPVLVRAVRKTTSPILAE
jgi:tetratricopeptide (TPR) repeat protein